MERLPQACLLCLCVQVFGPYSAQVLAAACEQTLMDCLSHLDMQLDSLQDILEPVMDVLTVSLDLHVLVLCTEMLHIFFKKALSRLAISANLVHAHILLLYANNNEVCTSMSIPGNQHAR